MGIMEKWDDPAPVVVEKIVYVEAPPPPPPRTAAQIQRDEEMQTLIAGSLGALFVHLAPLVLVPKMLYMFAGNLLVWAGQFKYGDPTSSYAVFLEWFNHGTHKQLDEIAIATATALSFASFIPGLTWIRRWSMMLFVMISLALLALWAVDWVAGTHAFQWLSGKVVYNLYGTSPIGQTTAGWYLWSSLIFLVSWGAWTVLRREQLREDPDIFHTINPIGAIFEAIKKMINRQKGKRPN